MVMVKVAAMDYGLDGMDLDVEDSGAGEEVQVGDDDIDDGDVDDENDDDDDDYVDDDNENRFRLQ